MSELGSSERNDVGTGWLRQADARLSLYSQALLQHISQVRSCSLACHAQMIKRPSDSPTRDTTKVYHLPLCFVYCTLLEVASDSMYAPVRGRAESLSPVPSRTMPPLFLALDLSAPCRARPTYELVPPAGEARLERRFGKLGARGRPGGAAHVLPLRRGEGERLVDGVGERLGVRRVESWC